MKTLLNLLVIIGIISNAFSQEKKAAKKAPKLWRIEADSRKAVKIPFFATGIYGPTVAPDGPGAVEEIKSSKKNDEYSFEREHNCAWYYFRALRDGDLVLEITPLKAGDDYDFMLFKFTDSTFFDRLAQHKLKPVRTNISRSGKEGDGRTGLSSQGKSEFIHAGPGEIFSKSLPVKKGEVYYLVLDNVYPEGGGHTVRLGYEKQAEISGTVLDEDNRPIKAEVILADDHGNKLAQMQSDSLTGKYNFSVSLWEKSPYTISFVQDCSFVETRQISTDYKLNDIRTVMQKLKGGRKYSLGGINFYDNSEDLLPGSYQAVDNLCRLMKKNPKMVIRIEGHVNGPGIGPVMQLLSEERAESVFDYLLNAGIDKERMSIVGFSNKFQLYPHPKSSAEESANRRVEINVISIR
jgi:outer membrane protein OmpA-like peptidoglycan-associated protein